MPPLLQSAQLKPDVTITSAESDDDIEESDYEGFVSNAKFCFSRNVLLVCGNLLCKSNYWVVCTRKDFLFCGITITV